MLLLHWSKGFFECQVSQGGSGEDQHIEVRFSDRGVSLPADEPRPLSFISFPSFDAYWQSYTEDPHWYMAWPVYIHPTLKNTIQGSINKIPLRELSSSEIYCVDKWKTYLHFSINQRIIL